MARIRTIKPELWSDPEFVECSTNARLLFVAGLNFASDYGVLPDKPKQLKMQCFPGDSFDVDQLVDELVAANLWVRRIAPDGARVLVIRTFAQHQRVERPNEGRWGNPANWPEIPGSLPDPSPNGRRALADDSESDHPRKGREGKGREEDLSRESSHDLTLLADQPAVTRVPFEQFWTRYPLKKAKAAAVKAWDKLDDEDRSAAIRAVPIHAGRWRHEHPDTDRYMPHAATWLNGRRWEDEVAPPDDGSRIINGQRMSADAIRRM